MFQKVAHILRVEKKLSKGSLTADIQTLHAVRDGHVPLADNGRKADHFVVTGSKLEGETRLVFGNHSFTRD